MEKLTTSVDTGISNGENTGLSSYPPLPTQGSTPAGNTPRISSYANVTCVPSRKALNFHTLFTPGGNGVDVVVPVESIRVVSKRFANTASGFFLGKRVAYPDVANYGRSSYARAMIELKADAELKDTIVVAMPKLTGEGFIRLGVAKNMKKTSQAPKGFPVGSKMGFKLAKEYRLVSKKPTANASGNKKNDVEPTNKGTSNSASKEPNSSASSFRNVESTSMSTTPIVEKIGKIENLIRDGKVNLVDDEGVPVKKVEYPSDYDSDDEVASVDNDMDRFMASEKVGYGTNSLLEQWKDSYENGNYDYDPYDDDMYEGQDIPDKLQAICDNLDIKVRGRKNK
ncbi:hypothetical protein Tco_0217426 [Tanacetum coccineum]